MTAELLTDLERDVVKRLGLIWNDLCQIVGDGNAAEYDMKELMAHVHALQHAVMAQAASRAYPTEFRGLGGWGIPGTVTQE